MSRVFRVVDTETTGLDPEVDRVCEIAWMDVLESGEFPGVKAQFRVNPGRPIPPAASAVHHLTDADVAEATAWDVIREWVMRDPPAAWVAHNAAFDRDMTRLPGVWICTYRLAKHLFPDAPGYSNQVLRYWLGLETGLTRSDSAHEALTDTIVTAHLFSHELKCCAERAIPTDPESLAAFIERPVLTRTPGFGKHHDTPWAEVPSDYLNWMRRQGPDNWDIDTKYTLETELEKRLAAESEGYTTGPGLFN